MDLFDELRTAVEGYDDWPTPEKRAAVIDGARRFVRAVEQRAAVIDQMRQHITPTEEALASLLDILKS
jgi:hypothetical protein